MSISRVAVVGAGIVGAALAREIAGRLPDAEVTVFDKAEHVGAHQSGHTSGIVDSGLDEEPGTLEATLARRGVELLVPYVTERGIPYRERGQLMIAQNTDEADRLEEIADRAEKNGIPGVRLVDRKQMRDIESHARGVLGLYSPHTAVTDFAALAAALASDVRSAGGSFRFGTEVTGFDVMSNEVRVRFRKAAHDSQVDGGDDHSDHSTHPDAGTHSDDKHAEDDSRDEQVTDGPRTYYGDDTEPVVGFGDDVRNRLGGELRDRFGDKDWFRQVEDTLGSLNDKLSNSWSGRGPSTTRSDSDRSGHDPSHAGGSSPHDNSPHGNSPHGNSPQGTRGPRGTRETHGGTVSEESASFDLVIVAAGLQADRLAVAAGFGAEPRVVPFTSDYFIVSESDPEAAEVVRGIITSVPDPHAPFADTALVRGVNDALVLGPNTFVALGREKYERHGFDVGDIGSTVGFKGFWKFAAQTAGTAARGAKSVVSTSAFVEGVQKFVPDLDAAAVRPGPRGVRARAMDAAGALTNELLVTTRGRLTMVRNVPRAGATSALAVAEHIVDSILDVPRPGQPATD